MIPDSKMAPLWSRIRPAQPVKLPRISPLLLRWFTWYCRGYLRRHFHSLRISRGGLPPDSLGLPLVIFTNHSSWWDPLVGLFIKDKFFPERALYAPIDATMLARYPLLGKLGFFGVEQRHPRGAAHFLRTSEALLQSPISLLAVTPQGRFADVRERPPQFQPGLSHLPTRVEQALFLPAATEFVFWEERLPEILVRFGEPLVIHREHNGGLPAEYWTDLFERKLEATQDALSLEAQARDPNAFINLLRGDAGQGGIYDWWRAFAARLGGYHFAKEHGTK